MIAFLLLTVNKFFFAIGHIFSVYRKYPTNCTPVADLVHPMRLIQPMYLA